MYAPLHMVNNLNYALPMMHVCTHTHICTHRYAQVRTCMHVDIMLPFRNTHVHACMYDDAQPEQSIRLSISMPYAMRITSQTLMIYKLLLRGHASVRMHRCSSQIERLCCYGGQSPLLNEIQNICIHGSSTCREVSKRVSMRSKLQQTLMTCTPNC